tara:strand:+ start:1443 stop:1580 length:138 start_codon:yes stop_codon:yes gene_type:complete
MPHWIPAQGRDDSEAFFAPTQNPSSPDLIGRSIFTTTGEDKFQQK